DDSYKFSRAAERKKPRAKARGHQDAHSLSGGGFAGTERQMSARVGIDHRQDCRPRRAWNFRLSGRSLSSTVITIWRRAGKAYTAPGGGRRLLAYLSVPDTIGRFGVEKAVDRGIGFQLHRVRE